MKYYRVAPLTHLANTDGLLTYASSGDLVMGSLVTIPLRNDKKQAVVIEEATKPDFETKEISAVISAEPVIDKVHIQLAEYISKEYFCTLGEALEALLPVTFGKNRRKLETLEKTKLRESSLTLSQDQEQILTSILTTSRSKPHLLFGVTGSGKTEIYLQLIDRLLKEGKGSIVLVPEISLTPQTVARFEARFGNQVALLHSNLKETEKFRTWEEIRNGQKTVVIGPRSALFAPVKSLGAIIIDEAHESSYKQDSTPRYQTTKVAAKLAALSGSYLILGTATPTIEQMFHANDGDYILHALNNRIVQTSMPEVEIVDMRNEFHYGNRSILSETLQREIKDAIARKRQVLLFLNRRGMSTFVSCRECGHVEKCPNCDIPLTFHYSDLSMRCHHCEHRGSAPSVCPKCKSLAIKYFGSGTQKVESEIKKLISKNVRITRMDSDTTNTREAHADIFETIKSGQTDIIIGTQMIAKGWDLGNIDLVGIISADALINLPDYGANERAFGLMLQVAGRTGRGSTQGKVVVQTYNPDLQIFRYLAKHDFQGFYDETLKERQSLLYPPFSKLINLLYNDASNEEAKTQAEVLAKSLTKVLQENQINAKVVGPAPAFIPKVRGKYRWQITLKMPYETNGNFEELYKLIIQTITKGWIIDVDPNGI